MHEGARDGLVRFDFVVFKRRVKEVYVELLDCGELGVQVVVAGFGDVLLVLVVGKRNDDAVYRLLARL